MKSLIKLSVLTFIVLQTQACALMFKEPTLSMPIITHPVDSSITIRDEKGVEVYKGKSPAVVELHKSDGTYAGGKHYLVTISKPGYKTKIFPVVPVTNNTYLYTNIFSIYIGWLIDPFFGNMYDLEPQIINVQLQE